MHGCIHTVRTRLQLVTCDACRTCGYVLFYRTPRNGEGGGRGGRSSLQPTQRTKEEITTTTTTTRPPRVGSTKRISFSCFSLSLSRSLFQPLPTTHTRSPTHMGKKDRRPLASVSSSSRPKEREGRNKRRERRRELLSHQSACLQMSMSGLQLLYTYSTPYPSHPTQILPFIPRPPPPRPLLPAGRSPSPLFPRSRRSQGRRRPPRPSPTRTSRGSGGGWVVETSLVGCRRKGRTL